jgi:cholesterol transport system auxiliary component
MTSLRLDRRAFAALSLGGTAAALTGCAAAPLLFNDPADLYTLTPKSTFDEDLPRVDWQLLVEIPVAAAGLDTARVAIRETPFRLDYYADVAWSTRAPEMVQTLLVESLENTDRIVSVGRESIGLRADYVLKTELREFQAEYLNEGDLSSGELPQVRVRINAKLVRIPERVIVAGTNFEDVRTPAANRIGEVMESFDVALGEVLKDLVEWTLRTGEADWTRDAA